MNKKTNILTNLSYFKGITNSFNLLLAFRSFFRGMHAFYYCFYYYIPYFLYPLMHICDFPYKVLMVRLCHGLA